MHVRSINRRMCSMGEYFKLNTAVLVQALAFLYLVNLSSFKFKFKFKKYLLFRANEKEQYNTILDSVRVETKQRNQKKHAYGILVPFTITQIKKLNLKIFKP